MALVLFRAWTKYEGDKNADEIEWDDIGEWQQQGYLIEVHALLNYLFEHGRISAYISYNRLETLKTEYRAYLQAKNEVSYE